MRLHVRLLAIISLFCAVSAQTEWQCDAGFSFNWTAGSSTVLSNAACCTQQTTQQTANVTCAAVGFITKNIIFACKAGTVNIVFGGDSALSLPLPSQSSCCTLPTCANINITTLNDGNPVAVAFDCGSKSLNLAAANMTNPSADICCEASYVPTCMGVTKEGDYYKCQSGTKNRDVQIGSTPTQNNCCEAYTPTCDLSSTCFYRPDYGTTHCNLESYICPSGKSLKLSVVGLPANDANCCENFVPTCGAFGGPFSPYVCPEGQVLNGENARKRQQLTPQVCCQDPTCGSVMDLTCRMACSTLSTLFLESLDVKAAVASNKLSGFGGFDQLRALASYCCTSPTSQPTKQPTFQPSGQSSDQSTYAPTKQPTGLQASGADTTALLLHAAFPAKLAFGAFAAVLVDMLW
jgi:hypothetical protein